MRETVGEGIVLIPSLYLKYQIIQLITMGFKPDRYIKTILNNNV
jgi:hypothetical protein